MESGQAYRAKLLRNIGMDAKFVFATTFPDNNIQNETEYLGFWIQNLFGCTGFLQTAGFHLPFIRLSNLRVLLAKRFIAVRVKRIL